MSSDPLDRFRKRFTDPPPPSSASLVVNHSGGRAPYLAFEAKDKVSRLDIRCRQGAMSHAVAYNYVLNISYDRQTNTEFFFNVSGLTVRVKGRALQPVIHAIKQGTCEFIQEYDPEEFAAPADPAGPIIDSIKVTVIGSNAAAA